MHRPSRLIAGSRRLPARSLRQPARPRAAACGESGSLLLDVLIGMAIFAIVALIAISGIEGYRQRAYEAGAISDVKGLAQEVEATYILDEVYPYTIGTDATPRYWYQKRVAAPVATFDQIPTKNNQVYQYSSYADGTFCISVAHHYGAGATDVDAWAKYDSSTSSTTHGRGRGDASGAVCR